MASEKHFDDLVDFIYKELKESKIDSYHATKRLAKLNQPLPGMSIVTKIILDLATKKIHKDEYFLKLSNDAKIAYIWQVYNMDKDISLYSFTDFVNDIFKGSERANIEYRKLSNEKQNEFWNSVKIIEKYF